MKSATAFILTILILILLLASCSPKVLTNTVHDVETVVRERVETVTDTVYRSLPPTVLMVDVPDTVSHLESEYACSDARWSSGRLYHTLVHKDTPVKVETQTVTVYRDSVCTEYKDNVVEVEKKLSGTQKFAITGFWTILAAAVVAVALWLYLRIRKKTTSS